MTVWWSQFQVGEPAQQRGYVGEDALARRRISLCTAPAQRFTTLAATLAPVTPRPASARAGQASGEALSKIWRSPLAKTANPKAAASRSSEHDNGRALHGAS